MGARRHPLLMRVRPILAAAVLAALSGCAATRPAPAPHVDGAAVARSVVLCTTTEADLRAALGEPTRDGLLHRARVMSWITGDDEVVHFLAVLLDSRGVVVDLYWDLPGEIPWTPENQCL